MTTSFAVTAFNEMAEENQRGGNIMRSIESAQAHDDIREIVIADDRSGDFSHLQGLMFGETSGKVKMFGEASSKVKLFHNDKNRGVFGNKLEAVARCKGDWVINCDSDNYMSPEYLDLVLTMPKDPDTWYCPSFAKPQFDYRQLVGNYGLGDMTQMFTHPMAGCCMNTGNSVVHRESFMEVFGKFLGKRFDLMLPNYLNRTVEQRESHYDRLIWDANDSFIFNMEWLSAGKKIQVAEGMEYAHFYTSGPASNYARAPVEKTALNKALVTELLKRSTEQAREIKCSNG